MLTVAGAVAFDLFEGQAPMHAAALGLVTALAVALRVRLAGRGGGLPQFVCGCVVSQPALHHLVRWMPHPGLEHGDGVLPGPADLAAVALQAAVVLALVAGLTYVEQLLLGLTIGAARRCLAATWSARPGPAPDWVAPAAAAITIPHPGRYDPGSLARRGPPVLAAS